MIGVIPDIHFKKKRTTRTKNKIIKKNNYYEVCLYDHKCQEVARTKIDKKNLEKIKQYKWCLRKYYRYAITTKGKQFISLHQLILGKKKGHEIDHINHDGLDNREKNLRFATKTENGRNRKNAKGIWWRKGQNKWIAEIFINGKKKYLGQFNEETTALKVRRKAELKYFGEFAPKTKIYDK